MVQLGILTNSYNYPTLETTLDAIARDGLSCVQFEQITAGIAHDAEQVDGALSAHVRQALTERGLRMAALSGTVNMIHPDSRARADRIVSGVRHHGDHPMQLSKYLEDRSTSISLSHSQRNPQCENRANQVNLLDATKVYWSQSNLSNQLFHYHS